MDYTIELSEDELSLLHSALHAFFDDFGHDQEELLRRVEELIAKLPAPRQSS